MAKQTRLEALWARAMKALGPIAGVVPTIAKNIKIGISDGNVEKIRGHVVELQEAAAALGGLASHIEVAISDGSVDLEEGAAIALKIEYFVDQMEDVVKGFDEDKPSTNGGGR